MGAGVECKGTWGVFWEKWESSKPGMWLWLQILQFFKEIIEMYTYNEILWHVCYILKTGGKIYCTCEIGKSIMLILPMLSQV